MTGIIPPPPIDTDTFWFQVPAGHTYVGIVRIAHNGDATPPDSVASIAITNGGPTILPVGADWQVYKTPLSGGLVTDLTFEIQELYSVWVNSAIDAHLSFNFNGMDKY